MTWIRQVAARMTPHMCSPRGWSTNNMYAYYSIAAGSVSAVHQVCNSDLSICSPVEHTSDS